MNTPVTVNPFADIVNKALSSSLSASTKSIQAALIVEAPFLGLPVVRSILGLALDYVGGLIYEQLAMAATKVIIDLESQYEASKTYEAFAKAEDAVKSGDQNAIKKASDELDQAFSSLVHYDGSATP